MERLEARIKARASPGERPPWRTPEAARERERQFRKLYRELGLEWPPEPKSREELREQHFRAIAEYRENERKERQQWNHTS